MDNLRTAFPYKNYKSFIGGMLVWNESNENRSLEIYNLDTLTISNKILCIDIFDKIPIICNHTGVIIGIKNNKLLAFTINNKILWEKILLILKK